jgi:tetratricopeptide (TPR) repeat protein
VGASVWLRKLGFSRSKALYGLTCVAVVVLLVFTVRIAREVAIRYYVRNERWADSWGLFKDGWSHYQAGEYAAAISDLDYVVGVAPRDGGYARQYSVACRVLGDCYLYTDAPGEAEEAYGRSLAFGVENARAYYGLARTNALAGDFEAAMGLLTKSIALDSTIAPIAVLDPYLRSLPQQYGPIPAMEGSRRPPRSDRPSGR